MVADVLNPIPIIRSNGGSRHILYCESDSRYCLGLIGFLSFLVGWDRTWPVHNYLPYIDN